MVNMLASRNPVDAPRNPNVAICPGEADFPPDRRNPS